MCEVECSIKICYLSNKENDSWHKTKIIGGQYEINRKIFTGLKAMASGYVGFVIGKILDNPDGATIMIAGKGD